MPRGGRYKEYFDNNDRKDSVYREFKRKCKCGKVLVIPKASNREYYICSWCGRRMYKDLLKQQKYEEKRDLQERSYLFRKALRQCINKVERLERKKMEEKLKKLRTKHFKNDDEYFKFCNRSDVTIYNVIIEVNSEDSNKKIKVYYGPHKGRPKKSKCREEK